MEGVCHANNERRSLQKKEKVTLKNLNIDQKNTPGTTSREATDLTRRDQGKHNSFVQRERLSLLHFDTFFVQAFHGVHLARVRLSTSVDLAESSASDDAVDAEREKEKDLSLVRSRFKVLDSVTRISLTQSSSYPDPKKSPTPSAPKIVHRQLNVEFQIFPLAKPNELFALDELQENVALQDDVDFLEIWFEEVGRKGGDRVGIVVF